MRQADPVSSCDIMEWRDEENRLKLRSIICIYSNTYLLRYSWNPFAFAYNAANRQHGMQNLHILDKKGPRIGWLSPICIFWPDFSAFKYVNRQTLSSPEVTIDGFFEALQFWQFSSSKFTTWTTQNIWQKNLLPLNWGFDIYSWSKNS